MRLHVCLAALIAAAQPVAAKPLVTSSEDTHARVCLARTEAPDRIVSACDAALGAARLTQVQRAELLAARGDGQFWQNDPATAAASYRGAIGWDPRSVEAWNGLGWALWETEGDIAAHEAFETSLRISVTVEALGGAAATGRRSGKIGNDEARRMLEAALAIDPDYVWAMREIGWSHLDDGRPALAVPAFEAALDADQDDANALYGLGRARLSLGDAAAAFGHFEASLGSEPESFGPRVYRITALRMMNRNGQALREAERLVADHPTKASGYIEKGRALLALERRAEAIETFARGEAAVGPSNAILYWHADALASDKRFTEALAVIERGLALEGADHSDHLLKSYIALELGEYALARAAAEAALSSGIEDPWAHYYIAIAMVHGGHITEGVAQFERAVLAGLPEDRIGAFATELVRTGSYVEAVQVRLKY